MESGQPVSASGNDAPNRWTLLSSRVEECVILKDVCVHLCMRLLLKLLAASVATTTNTTTITIAAIFTRTTLASTGNSCCHVSFCPSVSHKLVLY